MDFWAKADRCCHSPFMRKASTPSSPLLMFTCRKVPRNFQGSKDKTFQKKDWINRSHSEHFKKLFSLSLSSCSYEKIIESWQFIPYFSYHNFKDFPLSGCQTVRGFQIHLASPINSPHVKSPLFPRFSTRFYDILGGFTQSA